MDLKEYSNQISSYIDLDSIRLALKHRTENINMDIFKMEFSLDNEATDRGFSSLVIDYLKNFRVSNDVIELIVALDGSDCYSKESISWVKNYKFDIESQINLQCDSSNNNAPLLSIKAENEILDIINCPIYFIYNCVCQFASTWSDDKPEGFNAFLQHSHPSELFVHIERRVAMTCKSFNKSRPGKNAQSSIINGYRYVCITDNLPIDERIFEVAKRFAFSQAISTLR
uniref:Uncharacterized protein n=1 Tax=Marinomonas sp. (strain MWYL1) TaxID=400668 RepID=A6VW42_MARMS